MVEFSQVLAARETVAGQVHPTPVFTSTQLGNRLGVKLWLKAELFQKTGSFKPRGALNRLRHTSREELERGLITISAGNHAMGLAWAAKQVGAVCMVVMHAAASPTKVAAARGYGAEVILHGTVPEAFAQMTLIQRERHLTLIHPFDDPLVIAGQGTVGLEILEQVPDVDVIVVGVGGGGLISGIALAAKSLKPGVRVYGVEPEGSSVMRQSWDKGEVVYLHAVNTIADGLGAPMAGQITYPMTRQYVDDIILVTEDEIVAGIKALMGYAKLYAEPAGAAATGALLAGKIPVQPGETVVSVVSGGNLDFEKLKNIL